MKVAAIAGRVHVDHPSGGWVDVARVIPGAPSCLRTLLENGDVSALVRARFFEPTSAYGAALDVPIRPLQIVDSYCYEGHAKSARARRGLEMIPEWYDAPVYYRTNPRGLIATGQAAFFPADETEPDYELELACIVGTHLLRPSLAEAEAAIFGYTLFCDWSSRRRQRTAMKVGLGPNPGKDFATGLGPVIVTRDELPDVADLVIDATVDGELWSRGRVGDARWTFSELLCAVAETSPLGPGDVVALGTVNGGSGYEQGRVLKDGAVVALSASVIGTLTGRVARARATERSFLKGRNV
jgi:2-keto-4-pentenoate hydratase/2-oxohepta-3-ene-1,7-dioic acid hydratase in catechol pathway